MSNILRLVLTERFFSFLLFGCQFNSILSFYKSGTKTVQYLGNARKRPTKLYLVLKCLPRSLSRLIDYQFPEILFTVWFLVC